MRGRSPLVHREHSRYDASMPTRWASANRIDARVETGEGATPHARLDRSLTESAGQGLLEREHPVLGGGDLGEQEIAMMHASTVPAQRSELNPPGVLA